MPKISKRVLIADEDARDRSLLKSALTSAGYFVVEAHDSRAAFRILRADANFEAALFDLGMRNLNGLDLTQHMRSEKRLKRIPVMLITSETDLKVMSDSFAAGAVAFLSKPLTTEKVQTALRVLLAGARNPLAA